MGEQVDRLIELTRVTVPSHPRRVGGKTIMIDGYTYDRDDPNPVATATKAKGPMYGKAFAAAYKRQGNQLPSDPYGDVAFGESEITVAGGDFLTIDREEVYEQKRAERFAAIKPSENPKPGKIRLEFSETEHSGDLERYVDDLHKAEPRMKILRAGLVDYEYETGYVEVEVPDREFFAKRLRETDAGEMLASSYELQ